MGYTQTLFENGKTKKNTQHDVFLNFVHSGEES